MTHFTPEHFFSRTISVNLHFIKLRSPIFKGFKYLTFNKTYLCDCKISLKFARYSLYTVVYAVYPPHNSISPIQTIQKVITKTPLYRKYR